MSAIVILLNKRFLISDLTWGQKFITRHVRVHFKVLFHVPTSACDTLGHRYRRWYDKSPFNTFVNKNEHTLPNYILAHGWVGYSLQLSAILFPRFCLEFLQRASSNALRELTKNTRGNCDVWRVSSREQCYKVHIFRWRHVLYRKNVQTLLCRNTASYWNVPCVFIIRISPFADIEV